MSTAYKQRHDEVLQELAARYQAKGYSIEVEPLIQLKTGAMARPDLVARRGAETVLVEVRMASPAGPTPALRELAELAQLNGWRFVVAVADSRDVEEIEIPSAAEIQAKLSEVRTLGESTASSLLAWAVLEAAARYALARLGRRPPRTATSSSLIQQLASLGLVDVDEESRLHEFANVRNRLAHGFWSQSDPQPKTNTVLRVAEKLLATQAA